MTVQLKWFHQFQFAGFYAAQTKGFYSARGLEVNLVEASPSHLPLATVASGAAEFGVSDMEVFEAFLHGQPVVALGVVFQHSPNVILALRNSGIHHPSDLAGKRVMFQGKQGLAECRAMLAAEGIRENAVTFIPHTWKLDDLLLGHVEAISAYATNEPYLLREHGADLIQIRPGDYGVDFYGDMLFTTRSLAAAEPEMVDAFRRASLEGWEYAMDHPEELIDHILQLPGVQERGLTRAKLRFEAEQMRALMLPHLVDLGHMNAGRLRKIAEHLLRTDGPETWPDPAGFLFEPPKRLSQTWLRSVVIGGTALGAIGVVVALWILQLRRTVRARTQELRTSRDRLDRILDSLDSAVFIKDNQYRYTYVNRKVCEVFQREPQEIIGRTDADFFSPASVETIRKSDHAVIEEGRSIAREEVGLQGPSGQSRTYWSVKIPLKDAAGHITELCGFATDITERKLSEVALREAREMAERYLDVVEVILVAFDTEARITLLNRKGHAVLGYEPGELEGKDWFQVCLPPEESEAMFAVYRRIIAGEIEPLEYFENHIVRKDGIRRLIAWHNTLLRDEQGCVTGCLSSGEDITDRRRAEANLRESEERLRGIFEASEAGIILVSPVGTIQLANRRMAEMFGSTPEALAGSHYREFLHPAEREVGDSRMHQLILGEIQAVSLERHYLRTDGSDFWGFLSGRRLLNPDGSLRALVGIITDITPLKELEREREIIHQKLVQAQKMESLGSLAGGVAHDMNNVLCAILAIASTIKESQPEGSRLRLSCETITKAATRGGKLVRSLLDFARQSPAEERDIDLNTLLQEEIHLLERTTLARVAVKFDPDPGLRLVRGDAAALTHAIMNLCVNAVDAMPDGGTLTLRTRNLPDHQVEVAVGDTGCGMSKEVLDRALDPFFTTKEIGKGTGLGLSMVYSTITAHRGAMEIHSEPDRGTLVRLLLPACTPLTEGPGTPQENPPSAPARASLRVLLVDDDDLVRVTIESLLQELGYDVSAASSGEEALKLIGTGLIPDVVILDMNMPGWGGRETLPRLRERLKAVPVLLATGRPDQEAINLVEAFPMVDLLAKPFSLQDLRQKLAMIQPADA